MFRIWCVVCGERLTRIRRNYCVSKGVFSEPNLSEFEGENVRIEGHSGGDFNPRRGESNRKPIARETVD